MLPEPRRRPVAVANAASGRKYDKFLLQNDKNTLIFRYSLQIL
nr:MAG TPA: hypothetical protein [Caudoviricetes sp.]